MSRRLLYIAPHVATFCALGCGIEGMIAATQGHFIATLYWACGAAAFDVLDGLLARSLNTVSELGKALDALTDAINFGLLPAWTAWHIQQNLPTYHALITPYLVFVFTGAALWRLAQFTTQKNANSFRGLPTPLAALCLLSATALNQNIIQQIPMLIPAISILLAILMISPIHCIAFKFKHIQWVGNAKRYILITAFGILLLAAQEYVFLLFTPLYLGVSLAHKSQ